MPISPEQASNKHVGALASDFRDLQAMDDADAFAGRPDGQRRIDYLPTPAEIRDACRSIRQNWTRNEERRRFVGDRVSEDEQNLWRPPVIDTTHFLLSAGRVAAGSGR